MCIMCKLLGNLKEILRIFSWVARSKDMVSEGGTCDFRILKDFWELLQFRYVENLFSCLDRLYNLAV